MKFEAPVAEVTKFDLVDVISTSGGEGGETEATTRDPNNKPGTFAAMAGIDCTGKAIDNFNYDNCM